ncbi:hypothetical protein [Afifella pfennigii]|uniref:hypothetical protein n=1 Tax=Afifella pfennigii TaxID=209897 RepID=UPI0004789E6F|nr:hypothetical protein [Afifella pfennigii]
MARALKFANAILCEYAARGDRKKHTLVNIYSGDVVVRSFPARLQFGIYAEFVPQSEETIELSLDVVLGEQRLATIEVGVTNHKAGLPTPILVSSMQVNVEKEARLELVARRPGYRKTVVLSKRIFQGAVAEV